jgi:enediyne biosynthesis protein E4
LFLSGNYFDNQTELGRYDANYGQVYVNKGSGRFAFVPNKKHGLSIKGQVRNTRTIKIVGRKNSIILAKNSEKAQLINF